VSAVGRFLVGAHRVDQRLKAADLVLEREHLLNALQIQPTCEHCGDAPRPLNVLGTVATRAAIGAEGIKESARLVRTEHLRLNAGELCSHGYRVRQ
jgi:hypothetical protein